MISAYKKQPILTAADPDIISCLVQNSPPAAFLPKRRWVCSYVLKLLEWPFSLSRNTPTIFPSTPTFSSSQRNFENFLFSNSCYKVTRALHWFPGRKREFLCFKQTGEIGFASDCLFLKTTNWRLLWKLVTNKSITFLVVPQHSA